MNKNKKEADNLFEFFAKTQSMKAELGKRLQKIKERILSGETTGNEVLDFVITNYSSWGEKIITAYENIRENTQKHVGEFILIAVREKIPFGFHNLSKWQIFPGMEMGDYSLIKHLHLGVLQGTLILKVKKTWEIPVGCFVLYSPERKNREPKLVRKNLNGWYGMLPYDLVFGFGILTDPCYPQVFSSQSQENNKPELVIGDVNVMRWFKHHRLEDCVLQKMASYLGRSDIKI